jgi:hypothetical protein
MNGLSPRNPNQAAAGLISLLMIASFGSSDLIAGGTLSSESPRADRRGPKALMPNFRALVQFWNTDSR